jgi:hypothetical protein
MNNSIGYHGPRYLVGDLVRPISKIDRRDQVGIVVSIERTIGKLSNAVPYSYLVKWPDNSTSEWGGSSIELAKED